MRFTRSRKRGSLTARSTNLLNRDGSLIRHFLSRGTRKANFCSLLSDRRACRFQPSVIRHGRFTLYVFGEWTYSSAAPISRIGYPLPASTKMGLLKSQNKASPNASRFDVFISYSRDDEAFVRRLYDTLNEKERSAWVDWKGIAPTADWMAEIFAAVESADNFIVVLSQASLTSEVCGREIQHAVKCRKRLVPFVWGDIDDDAVPDELRRLNWIICRNDDDFPRAADALLEALTLNLEWVREHTRLLVRAVDWRDGNADPSLLLRGSDLREAEQWLAKGVDEEPKPTELHRDYVLASRTQETRRGRRTLTAVVAGLVLAIGLAVVALVQRQEATKQATIAEERKVEADKRRQEAVAQRIEAERQSVVALTNESSASLALGRGLEALLASVKAGKKLQHEETLRDGSSAVVRSLVALRHAIESNYERNRIETGHFRGVTDIAFTPDDQAIYSVGGDGDIKRWDLSGKLLLTIATEHIGEGDGCDAIQNFAVSPDGKMLATLGNEGRFVLWNTEGKEISSFDSGVERSGEEQYCTAIIDSKISFASQSVTIRDSTQQIVWTFNGAVTRTPMETPPGEQPVNLKVTNKDGTFVAVSGDGGTITVNRRNGSKLLRLAHQLYPTFSNTSNQLATVSGGLDSTIVHLWDLSIPSVPVPGQEKRPAEPKRKLKLGDKSFDLEYAEAFGKWNGGRWFEGVVSPDGQFAAVLAGSAREKIALWRLASGSAAQLIAEFDADQLPSADFAEAFQSLAFSSDSKLLVSGGADGSVKVWDMNGKLMRRIVAHTQFTNARLSSDGRLLLTWVDRSDGQDALKLWTIDGELLDSLSTEDIADAWFTSDGKGIFALVGKQQKFWSLDLDQLLQVGCNALHLYLANPTMLKDSKLCV
jgi:WD40 repeat protein